MTFIYTKHAEDKLKEPESKTFGISKELLELTVLKPKTREVLKTNQFRSTGSLDKFHSLVIVHRKDYDRIVIITFFPAVKDRYEAKVLRRR